MCLERRAERNRVDGNVTWLSTDLKAAMLAERCSSYALLDEIERLVPEAAEIEFRGGDHRTKQWLDERPDAATNPAAFNQWLARQPYDAE